MEAQSALQLMQLLLACKIHSVLVQDWLIQLISKTSFHHKFQLQSKTQTVLSSKTVDQAGFRS